MILRTLIILFIALPLLELLVLLKIGEIWGAELTILLVLVTGITGAFLAKSQGISVWNRIHRELSQGRIPGDQLIDGLMIFAGGVTLLTPGLITDTIGLCLLIPPTRHVIKQWLKTYFRKKVDAGQIIIDQ